jgi:hypothetical protein
MFNVIVVSVLIVLIIHYTIDIFTKVEPPGVDPRVQKYKSIIESQVVPRELCFQAVESKIHLEQEQELEQYVQTLIYNGI